MLFLFGVIVVLGMLGAMFYLNILINDFEKLFEKFNERLRDHYPEALATGPAQKTPPAEEAK